MAIRQCLQLWSNGLRFFTSILTTRFLRANLSALHVCADRLLDWSLAAKWARLLISYLWRVSFIYHCSEQGFVDIWGKKGFEPHRRPFSARSPKGWEISSSGPAGSWPRWSPRLGGPSRRWSRSTWGRRTLTRSGSRGKSRDGSSVEPVLKKIKLSDQARTEFSLNCFFLAEISFSEIT